MHKGLYVAKYVSTFFFRLLRIHILSLGSLLYHIKLWHFSLNCGGEIGVQVAEIHKFKEFERPQDVVSIVISGGVLFLELILQKMGAIRARPFRQQASDFFAQAGVMPELLRGFF